MSEAAGGDRMTDQPTGARYPAVVIERRPFEGCNFGAASKCGKPPRWSLGGVPLCQEHAMRMCKIVPAAREKLTPWGRKEGDGER